MGLAPAALGGQTLESDASDQTGVEVTVYNNGLGLVKDSRKIDLIKGEGELRFMDVASHIKPETVHVKALKDPGGFSVLEQNYEYDLINSNKLLNKYVGKKIKIIDVNKFQDRKEIIEATLISNNNGQVYRIGDEIYLGHRGYKVLPKLPEDLISKPTLTWIYGNDSKTQREIEVSYLTTNISWKADYVLLINESDTKADVSGWVTMDNRSGAKYKDAKLKLVAGDVNRAAPEPIMTDGVLAAEAAPRRKAKQFKEESFFEYHIYDLERPTTINNNQKKQIKLLEAAGAKCSKELLVYGVKTYFSREYRPRNPKQPVSVYMKVRNSEENGMGMPLPKGVMRLYKKDSSGAQQFIGEDRIEHTPKDETIKLKVGEAFDVVAERRQVDYKRITTRLHESEWEITLRNHKKAPVTVGIVEPLYGNWTVVSNSHPFEKKDAFTIRFDVKVPRDEEVKVKYRIRVGL
jgi:hypothetical protein